jgi:hypothetical protein
MQCNIDSKGKAVRLAAGIACLVIATMVGAMALAGVFDSGAKIGFIVAGLLLVSGAFMVFEGWSGWCVVRAMGFKTKI